MKLNSSMLSITQHNFNSDHAKTAKVFNRCLNTWLSQKSGILLSSVQNLIEHLQLTNNAKESRFYQATLNI
jgi:hypothetical protein